LQDEKQQKDLLDCISTLARFFWGPDIKSIREVFYNTYLAPFEASNSYVYYTPKGIFKELKAITSRFRNEDEIFQYLESAYVRLFVNSRDGIIAPLYASCYDKGPASDQNSPLMGSSATMMKQLLESKELSLGNDIHEPPDHLSIELEYLYFLLEKEWSDDDTVLLSEAASFADEVMLPWVTSLQSRIAEERECRFYPLITALLVSILTFIAQIHKKLASSPD
jgi:TorA-specific chaperone